MALSTIAQSVKRARLTYLNSEKLARLEALAAHAALAPVNGDFVELGMALGGSGIVLASHAGKAGRAFHGFDVFGVIPAPSSVKDDQKSRVRYDVITSGEAVGIGGEQYYGYRKDLYTEVVDAFGSFGLPVDGEQIVLHKGLFADTLPDYKPKSLALMHLDCDWYDPVKLCLSYLSPMLSVGGVVVLDDYYAYKGCRAATDEFCSDHKDFEFDGSGPSALLRRKY